MYRLSLSKPGAAAPYQIIYAREAGTYRPGEIAPLGGKFEVLRGEFGGPGSVKVSAPVAFEAGDWLRIWLKGDADDDPTYLGEVGGEPWQIGAGEIQARPLKDTVSQARWSGTITAKFALYLGYVIGHCILPPGVTLGDIPVDLATLKAVTLFELLGDTFQAAMPVIDGGTWGVDNRGRIGAYRPDTELTHRFPRTRSEISPGDTSGYRNAVRFSYNRPDGTEAWFEGRIESEIVKRGEVWEPPNQIPARVGEAADNPLDGVAGTVDIATKFSGYYTDIGTGLPVYFEYPGPYVAHQTGLFFNADFAGVLATPNMFTLQAGEHMHPATVDESVMTVTLPSASYNYGLDVIVDNHGLPLGQVLEVRRSPSQTWVAANETVNNGFLKQIEVFGGYTTDIRYKPSFFATYAPSGLSISVNGQVRGTLPPGSSASNIKAHVIMTCRNDAGQFFTVPIDAFPFTGNPNNSLNATAIAEGGYTRTLSPASAALVTPPAPVFLTAGSAVLTFFNTAVTGTGIGATGVSLVTPGGDIPLTRGTTTDNVTRWTYAGDGVSVSAFKLTGDPTRIGRILPQLSSTGTLSAYAFGLLRYRVQPVRSWTGQYRRLRRVACRGVSRFETMQGEVDLDVQRVTYDLSAGTVSVECGTPQASSDDDATAAAIERVRQEMRAGK
ncbi:hypothetical protein GCM10022631_11670 [Deinococcus rubellus]|uniref:Minor tail protein n=1 Tax=Deinococcus rubellus TaxID=1889240 RepID=A0ABY5YD97_9DEIO|nr:hypothetical protein [Deinococcus rubellus]UWX62788.1 hypothetical protein N0D28_08375 [Deinococcus rubellus]